MKLILHTGAHFAEGDRLLKCLLRNQGDLLNRSTAVPGPGKYRRLVRDTLNAMHTVLPVPNARDVLLNAMLDGDTADRVVLSNPHFYGSVQQALVDGALYPKAPEKLARMASIFPDDDINVYMGIRNPATFLPAVYEKLENPSMHALLGPRDPIEIRWSGLIAAMQRAVPNAKFTIWCNEDAPLLWGTILRRLAGYQEDEKIIGAFDLLGTIMSKEGMQRFRAYLKTHPVMNDAQRNRVIAAFLEKYVLEDAVEEELSMPGINEKLIEDMTEAYEEDLIILGRIPNVELLEP